MQCQTVLPGAECGFWGKKGCTFTDASCQVIVDKCEGCERVSEGTGGKVCSVYPAPGRKWQDGICNFATHVKAKIVSEETRVNPLKASKKAAGNRLK